MVAFGVIVLQVYKKNWTRVRIISNLISSAGGSSKITKMTKSLLCSIISNGRDFSVFVILFYQITFDLCSS